MEVAPLGQAQPEIEVVAVVEAEVKGDEELMVEQSVQYILLPHHLKRMIKFTKTRHKIEGEIIEMTMLIWLA